MWTQSSLIYLCEYTQQTSTQTDETIVLMLKSSQHSNQMVTCHEHIEIWILFTSLFSTKWFRNVKEQNILILAYH